MSRRTRKLKQAFNVEVSESRLRGLPGRARAKAIEAATRRLERGVDEETQRRIEEAEAKAARALANQQAAAERDRAREASRRQKRQEEAEQREACTCHRPNVDRAGKCKRCKKFPAGRRRR